VFEDEKTFTQSYIVGDLLKGTHYGASNETV
jgi:hypothetical protein